MIKQTSTFYDENGNITDDINRTHAVKTTIKKKITPEMKGLLNLLDYMAEAGHKSLTYNEIAEILFRISDGEVDEAIDD